MEIDKLPKHYDPLPEEEQKIFENLFGVVENFEQKSNDNTISYEEKQKKTIPIASTIAIFFLLLFSHSNKSVVHKSSIRSIEAGFKIGLLPNFFKVSAPTKAISISLNNNKAYTFRPRFRIC